MNRLVSITQGGHVTSFVYNGLGQRVQESLDGVLEKQWVWAGGAQPVEERDASNNVTKRFYGQGELLLTGANAGSYYFTKDHLGSVREMTDGSGVVRARYDHDPFGRRTLVSGADLADFGFTGFYHDQASGLDLTLYRAYDPNMGRWLNRDLAGERGGIDLYSYVENDPLFGRDPLGLWNLWNPLTWGQPTQPGENSWNPTDSSAEWAVTRQGAMKGGAAYLDGINPFGNPYQSLGVYDPCKDKGTGASRWLGKWVGRQALYTIVGASLASKFAGPLSRLPWIGKAGDLFGRARFGADSWLNSGMFRIGWGWNGVRDVFRVSWAAFGEGSYWNHFDIF